MLHTCIAYTQITGHLTINMAHSDLAPVWCMIRLIQSKLLEQKYTNSGTFHLNKTLPSKKFLSKKQNCDKYASYPD